MSVERDSASPANAETWLGAWENSADSVYCRDLNGRILAGNLSFGRKFGRDLAALAETAVTEFLHPDDLAASLTE